MDPNDRIQFFQIRSMDIVKGLKRCLIGLYSTVDNVHSGIKPSETKGTCKSFVDHLQKQMKSDDRWLNEHYKNVFNVSQLEPIEQEKFQSIMDHLTGLKDEKSFKTAIQYCEDLRSSMTSMGLSKKFEIVVKFCVAGILQLGGNEKESMELRETVASQASILNRFQVTDNLHQLAWLQFRLGKLPEAFETFKEALNLKCDLYGMEDYLTLNTYKSLGEVLTKQGNIEEACKIYNDAESIEEKMLREKAS